MGFYIGILIKSSPLKGGVHKLMILLRDLPKEFLRKFFGEEMGGYRGRGGYPLPVPPPPLRSRFLYRIVGHNSEPCRNFGTILRHKLPIIHPDLPIPTRDLNSSVQPELLNTKCLDRNPDNSFINRINSPQKGI